MITEDQITEAAEEFCKTRLIDSRGYPPKVWFRAGVRWAIENMGIMPVPITIDLLIKYGFKEKYELGDDFTVEEYTFRDYVLGQFDICYNRSDACFTCNNIVGINLQEYIFVHELQNLYYILTGKDLIKL